MAVDEGTYRSDKAGLVCAYAFAPGLPANAIDSAQAARYLAGSEGTDASFLWLHFNLTNAAAEPWLRRHLTLPAAFYESLRENPSTRVEAVGDALLAIVHDVQFFGAEPSSGGTVTLYVDRRQLISARTTQLRAMDRLRAAVKTRALFGSAVELLAHLLRDQADVLVEIVRDATKQVDAVEDKLLDSQLSLSRPKLGKLRRGLVRLQRLLAPEPAALFRLLNRPPQWLGEHDVEELRRSVEELAAAVADSVAVVERVRILQDELSARLDEETNRTLYILTILTAITAPFEFIPQLFGMGVGGMPLHDNPQGFVIVVVMILVVIGLGAMLVKQLMMRS